MWPPAVIDREYMKVPGLHSIPGIQKPTLTPSELRRLRIYCSGYFNGNWHARGPQRARYQTKYIQVTQLKRFMSLIMQRQEMYSAAVQCRSACLLV